MNRILLTGVTATIAITTALPAMAAEVWAVSGQSLRAGPGQHYPVVASVRAGTKLEAAGCLRDATWCNVEKNDGTFGWVRAAKLSVPAGRRHVAFMRAANADRPQVVTYNVNEYWDAHYKDSAFYADRGRYGYDPAPNDRPPMDRVNAQGDAESIANHTPRMLDDQYYSK